jgi:hypothetical protein
MDIIVTVPKKEFKNIAKEDEFINKSGPENCTQFWSIGRKPSNLKLHDRVYFVEDGWIKYWHEFLGFTKDPHCEVTSRTWPGLNLILKCPETILTNPIPQKGFQGFRYFQRRDNGG